MKNINTILYLLMIFEFVSCNNNPPINNPSAYINSIDSIRKAALNIDEELTSDFLKYDFYDSVDTVLYDSIFDSVTKTYRDLLLELNKLEEQAYGEDDAYRKLTIELIEHLIKIQNELFDKPLKASSNKNKDSLNKVIIRHQEKYDELYLQSRINKIFLYKKYRLDTINFEKTTPGN